MMMDSIGDAVMAATSLLGFAPARPAPPSPSPSETPERDADAPHDPLFEAVAEALIEAGYLRR